MHKYPTVFSPARLNRTHLQNRTVVAPLTRTSATASGEATLQMADYYRGYADNGWGLIIAESTYVDQLSSQSYLNQPGIANASQMAAWERVTQGVHEAGGKIVLQLSHAGALSQGNAWGHGTLAPTALQPGGEMAPRYQGKGPFPLPREITVAEINGVIAAFGAAAARAMQAGFDGVEVHGANGYLADQFLTASTNQRSDSYGGRLQNRLRFHLEVLAAVRAAVPFDKIMGVRMSQSKVNDFTATWPGGVDDAAAVFSALRGIQGIYVHVSSHTGCAPVFGTDQSLAGLARKYSGHQVIANGKLDDPAQAEKLLSSGQAEFISIGKGALADPAWPRKILAGEEPVGFSPDIFTPRATLDNAAAWRAKTLV
jgi:2,4-dienoyl-CoA reductase-like NADH-dependent reductase (Old Yellow Enzyme family)